MSVFDKSNHRPGNGTVRNRKRVLWTLTHDLPLRWKVATGVCTSVKVSPCKHRRAEGTSSILKKLIVKPCQNSDKTSRLILFDRYWCHIKATLVGEERVWSNKEGCCIWHWKSGSIFVHVSPFHLRRLLIEIKYSCNLSTFSCRQTTILLFDQKN